MAVEPHPDISLDDKYTAESGLVYLTGVQALVRLHLMQRQRDLAAGLNTAGFISGYRGSPLGGFDQALWKAEEFLRKSHIKFQPGVNEELAATAIWGTQQVNLYPGAKYDGVFACWYGKGPGVDRCGDVFKHANHAGTSGHGGVLALAGDDHAAKSSTLPHQSDHMFAAAMMPVLAPAGVQEYLDLGLHGWAMSRYAGVWVGMKAVTDTVESSARVDVDPFRVKIVVPDDFAMPPEGLNIRWPDPPLVQEARMQDYKVYAALHYARVNHLNRVVLDSPKARFGIICAGKSYLDVMQALDDLGIDERVGADIGLRVFKAGMTWPLEPDGVRRFAEGLEEILVVEEKRQVIEYQLKEQLYNWRESVRPRVIGKFDEKGEWAHPRGEWLLPPESELTPARIARVIATRIARFHASERIERRLAFLDGMEKALAKPALSVSRIPYFCSGCPHNTSTRVPEGSRAMAGIGCHYMAIWISAESTKTFTQMGGEGAPWIGQAPFTDTKHVFANLGDGTYNHSGLLAIRAAVAAKVDMTYKILFNDAVAMTGGQPMDGSLTAGDVARQVLAEGVTRVVVVTDRPEAVAEGSFPAALSVRHRDELDAVQRELREVPGVTVLLYLQTCAAEKRRRRKRKQFPDPPKRVLINDLVCEGCGDCSTKSNCVSVVPLETEYGRKRAIDQSTCNKDFSCLKGFCPSFVMVEGGRLRRGKRADDAEFPALPEPGRPITAQPYGIVVAGIGGTGVVTISALLGMAAHLDGKGVTVLDMAGIAQKNGAVLSHVRIADRQEQIHATRIADGDARLVLACDILVAVGAEALAKTQQGVTRAVVNSAQVMPGDFARNPDLEFPLDSMEAQMRAAVGSEQAEFVDAGRLANALMGDSIATNLFMVGYAYQRGLVPVSEASILRAIELNGAAVETNQASFMWGRRAAHDLARVEALATPRQAKPDSHQLSESLDETIARRVTFLTDYQDAAYARRYLDLVHRAAAAEAKAMPGSIALASAVARYYFKLLAVKDEYEVARLYTNGEFERTLQRSFEGDYTLTFYMAPPMWVKPDPVTGEVKKRKYGRWMLSAFRVLAKLKRLRGTPFDLFGHTDERRMERRLIADYETVTGEVLEKLTRHNHALAVDLASLPEHIRGFGHVKSAHLKQAKEHEARVLAAFRAAQFGAGVIPIRVAA
jgi:indolepyruvate ferredoxin oxidoreductase